MCACLRIDFMVPVLIEGLSGTITVFLPVESVFLSFAWLPLCFTKTNPAFSSAPTVSFPEITGNLGTGLHFKSRDKMAAF